MQAKFAYGGLVLGLSQFLPLPQPPQKMMHTSKVVKINSKKIKSLHLSKSATHSVHVCFVQSKNRIKKRYHDMAKKLYGSFLDLKCPMSRTRCQEGGAGGGYAYDNTALTPETMLRYSPELHILTHFPPVVATLEVIFNIKYHKH